MVTDIPEHILRIGYTKSYERKGLYEIASVLDFIGDYRKDYNGDIIKMNSDRYHTFARSTVCVACGLTGLYFAKERQIRHNRDTGDISITVEPYHFNLYAVDTNGMEVLMTKDHILARSKGGHNHINNYQTMCAKCNHAKGDSEE